MNGFKRLAAGAAAAMAVVVAVPSCAAFNQQWHSGCLVTDKETLYVSGGGGVYFNYVRRLATTCGQFEVKDAIEAGVTTSYDMWAKLQIGKAYDIRTGGFRIGVVSEFPIVLEVNDAVV